MGVVVVCKGVRSKMRDVFHYFEVYGSADSGGDLVKKAGGYPGRDCEYVMRREDIHTCEKLVK